MLFRCAGGTFGEAAALHLHRQRIGQQLAPVQLFSAHFGQELACMPLGGRFEAPHIFHERVTIPVPQPL